MQLNIALQKEIVRFTAVGIQRAIRETDELSRQNSSVRSSSLAKSLNIFVRHFASTYSVAQDFLIIFDPLMDRMFACQARLFLS